MDYFNCGTEKKVTDVKDYSTFYFRLEMERVLPQLKIVVKSDNRDWRAHLEQIKTLKTNIESVSRRILRVTIEIL